MIDEKIFDSTRNFHGAKGLVFIGEKILVYRRDGRTTNLPFYIDLPGGGREDNESPFETFKRETKEEFGVTLEAGDIVYSKQYMSIIDPTMEAYFMVAKPSTITVEDVVPSFEVPEPMMIHIADYLALTDAIPRHVERAKEYLKTVPTGY
jgi:8-oxo-dGTP diphosphatase